MSKEGSLKPFVITYIISILIFILWGQIPILKNSVHYVLDPTAGWLLRWDLTWGMMILVFIIAVISIVAQKYGTDQKTLKELRAEQKKMQEERKEIMEHPEKMGDFQKKQMDIMKKTWKLSTRSLMFTGVPFILLFRWFSDLFTANTGYTLTVNPIFFGFMTWFWFYLVFILIFSMILRKMFNVV